MVFFLHKYNKSQIENQDLKVNEKSGYVPSLFFIEPSFSLCSCDSTVFPGKCQYLGQLSSYSFVIFALIETAFLLVCFDISHSTWPKSLTSTVFVMASHIIMRIHELSVLLGYSIHVCWTVWFENACFWLWDHITLGNPLNDCQIRNKYHLSWNSLLPPWCYRREECDHLYKPPSTIVPYSNPKV